MDFFDLWEGINTDFILKRVATDSQIIWKKATDSQINYKKIATDSQISWKYGGWHPLLFYAGARFKKGMLS